MESNIPMCNSCNKKDTCNLKSDNVKECENFDTTKPEEFKCYSCGKILVKGKDEMRYIGQGLYKCGIARCETQIIKNALKGRKEPTK